MNDIHFQNGFSLVLTNMDLEEVTHDIDNYVSSHITTCRNIDNKTINTSNMRTASKFPMFQNASIENGTINI